MFLKTNQLSILNIDLLIYTYQQIQNLSILSLGNKFIDLVLDSFLDNILCNLIILYLGFSEIILQ